jgi:hypothetical protein
VAAAAPAAPAVTPPPPTEAPSPAAGAPAAILADAVRAASAEDWGGARASLDKLRAGTGDAGLDRQASDLGKRVDAERQAATTFAQLGEATTAKRYADALALYASIPAASVYKARGKAHADESRSLLVADRLAEAEKARAAGRCGDVRTAVADVERLDPGNALGKELAHQCRTKPEPAAAPRAHARAVAAASAPRERPTERQAERAEAAPAPAEPEVDADTLMRLAREAWLRQQCGSAIELSRKALKAKPGLSDAYQIIAVCSCSLKDVEGATRAYGKLDEKNRNLVRSLCQKNGVIVGSGDAP